MKKEFNGYNFEMKSAKRMKYLVVFEGDLDLNECYGFTSRKELKKHLKEDHRSRVTVFNVKLLGVFKNH